MKMPGILRLSRLVRSDWPRQQVKGGWVMARPLPFYSVWNRLRATWLVFTGQADAFLWDLETVDDS